MMFPKKKWGKGSGKKKTETNSVKCDKALERLWKWFSIFVRLRDCPTNSMGFGKCISCGKIDHYKNMHAGHYLSRRWKPTKFHEKNVHIQCPFCNTHLKGNVAEYRKNIVEKYGEESILEIEELSREKYKKPHFAEVEALVTYYRVLAKEEAERCGVIL